MSTLIDETSLLRLLRVRDREVARALNAADEGVTRFLARAEEHPRYVNPGLFCCGKCSVGLWRNLLSGGLNQGDERLRRGASHLRSLRDSDGMADVPVLVYGAGPERDGSRRCEGGTSWQRATIEVTNVVALFEEYESRGVELAQRLVRQPWGGHDFHVRDPDGNVIAFVEYERPARLE